MRLLSGGVVFKKLFIILLVGFVVGCTTAHKRAQNAVDKGNYEEAISLYEGILSKETGDQKAKSGLRYARLRWIDASLIQVRLLRLGTNYGQSEDLLRNIIQSEDAWGVFPAGVVFATQADELKYLFARKQKQIESALKDKKPLLAQYLYLQNKYLIKDTLKQNVSPIEIKILKKVKGFCKKQFKKLNTKEHYSNIWISKICDTWMIKYKKIKTKNSVSLFSEISPTYSIEGLDAKESQMLTEDFHKTFVKSKWYDKKSKLKWNLDISGVVVSKLDEQDVNLSSRYYVKIPYETSRIVVKDPEPKSTGAIGLLILLFGSSSKEVDNGDGTVTVYETEYREEPRTYHYKAIRVTQSMGIKLKLLSNIGGKQFKMNYVNSYFNRVHVTDSNFPEANVYPVKKKLVKLEKWLTSNNRGLFERISRKLSSGWRKSYCRKLRVKANAKKLSPREIMHRCVYGSAVDVPAMVKIWYMKNFGLDPSQVEYLIDKSGPDAYEVL